MANEFLDYPVAVFQPEGRSDLDSAFPVLSITEDGGNRIVIRERPYREGAKLDDTGGKPKRWRMQAIFNNSILEKDLLSINGVGLYPDVANRMIEAVDIHATGTLQIPTRGDVRVRLETYSRNEVNTNRDQTIIDFTFIADNEDNVDAASFGAPTASANATIVGETTTFSAESDGGWDGSLQDLNQFAADLEGIVNGPGDVARQVDEQAGIVISAANRVLRALSNPNIAGQDTLTDPDASLTQRKLNDTQDIAYRARTDARRGQPNILGLILAQNANIFQISTDTGEDVAELMLINPQIANLFFIPRGSLVNIHEPAQ